MRRSFKIAASAASAIIGAGWFLLEIIGNLATMFALFDWVPMWVRTFAAHEELAYQITPWFLMGIGVVSLVAVHLWPESKPASPQDDYKELNRTQGAPRLLKCSFSESIVGCRIPTPMFLRTPQGHSIPAGQAVYFRIRVETVGVPQVKDCQGTLIRLTRDGHVLFDQQAMGLNVANSDPANPRSKNIRDRVPEFIDVFLINEANKIVIATPGFKHPGAIHHETLFTKQGRYCFYVIVSSPDCASEAIEIELDWTGSIDTSTARQVQTQIESTRQKLDEQDLRREALQASAHLEYGFDSNSAAARTAAILLLARLRDEGVTLRNSVSGVVNDTAEEWIGDSLKWMRDVIDGLRLIDEADAEIFRTLDIVLPARVNFPIHVSDPTLGQRLVSHFNQHDLRLSRLFDLLQKYQGVTFKRG